MRRKVLLINPPELYYDNVNQQIHLAKPALIALHAFLRHHGVEAEILDFELETGRPHNDEDRRRARQRMRERIAALDFDVAAVSCYSSGLYLGALEVAEACRELKPAALRVAGGYHATARPQEFTGPNSPFQLVVCDEGEDVLLGLARGEIALEAGKTKVLHGTAVDLTQEVPLSLEAYRYNDSYRIRACTVNISRGCPFRCAYCVEPTRTLFPKWRAPSVDQSLRMLDQVVDVWNPLAIFLSDPIFGLSKPWRREFLRKLAKRKYKNIISAETRVDILEPEDLELMGDVSFHLMLGVESASPQMLYRMGKAQKPEHYVERTRRVLLQKTSKPMFMSLNLLFNHPGETPASVRETYDFFREMIPKTPHDLHLSSNSYKHYPGTPVADRLGDFRRMYGTEVRDESWWLKPTDQQFAKSQMVIASREMKTEYGADVFYWEKEVEDLQQGFRKRWSGNTRMTASMIAVGMEQNHRQWIEKTSPPAATRGK